MKHTITLLFLMLSLSACNQEQSRTSASQTVATIFEEYYQFKDRINPIEATKGWTLPPAPNWATYKCKDWT